MAAVDVTISGILYDKLNRTVQQVVLIGEASLTGVGVGGGPIVPPNQPPSGGAPPHPSLPIYWPGGPPGEPPPGFWGGGMGPGVKPQPHPEHPIVLPPDVPPDIPSPPDLFTWKVAWTEEQGWMVVAIPNVPHPVPSKK